MREGALVSRLAQESLELPLQASSLKKGGGHGWDGYFQNPQLSSLTSESRAMMAAQLFLPNDKDPGDMGMVVFFTCPFCVSAAGVPDQMDHCRGCNLDWL